MKRDVRFYQLCIKPSSPPVAGLTDTYHSTEADPLVRERVPRFTRGLRRGQSERGVPVVTVRGSLLACCATSACQGETESRLQATFLSVEWALLEEFNVIVWYP